VGDARGVVAIWVVVSMALFCAIGALVVDVGRLYNLHSQLVTFADHAALAAAQELNGENGAVNRALTWSATSRVSAPASRA